MAKQRKSRVRLHERADQRGPLAAVVLGRREALGLRQEELADLAGCSPRFVHDLEAGKATAQLDKVLDVLESLGLHLSVVEGAAGGSWSIRRCAPTSAGAGTSPVTEPGTEPGFDPTTVDRAAVHKGGQLAAHLTRTAAGVEFAYTDDWVAAGGRAVATTLPVTTSPVLSVGGAVPAFFAGLLPEGRRLTALRRSVKTSADDELSLLLAVGSDPVGDVQVVPEGVPPERASARLETSDFGQVSFAELLATYDVDIDRVAIAGVQDKFSLAMLSVPVIGGGSSYFLKLDPPEYPHLVADEAFFLARSARSRIVTAQARVVTDRDGREGLVVTRFDRSHRDGRVTAYAVEDGCQVLGLHPEAKYRLSTEEVLGALVRVCAAPRPAALEFLRQVVFAYLTGNGDAHAKNFSVLADDAGRWRPAPAYDLPSSYPYGDATMALRVDGDRDGNLTGRRFVALGSALGLPERAARRALTETTAAVDEWIDEVDELPFDVGVVRKLKRVVRAPSGAARDRLRKPAQAPTSTCNTSQHWSLRGLRAAGRGSVLRPLPAEPAPDPAAAELALSAASAAHAASKSPVGSGRGGSSRRPWRPGRRRTRCSRCRGRRTARPARRWPGR